MTTVVFLGDLSNKKGTSKGFLLNRPLYIIMDTCLSLKCGSLITVKHLEIIIAKIAE